MSDWEPRFTLQDAYQRQFEHCFKDLQRVGYKGRMLSDDKIRRLSNIFAVRTNIREWKRQNKIQQLLKESGGY